MARAVEFALHDEAVRVPLLNQVKPGLDVGIVPLTPMRRNLLAPAVMQTKKSTHFRLPSLRTGLSNQPRTPGNERSSRAIRLLEQTVLVEPGVEHMCIFMSN